MTIVIDCHIPFFSEAVREAWPDVQVLPMEPQQITADTVRDADVLVVRTRTRVDASLLADSNVRLVCSATIGFDHIDTAWLEAHGIRWTACPGCNAQAVCDYIEEVLDEFQISNFKYQISNPPTLGVVGIGHVGSLVAMMAKRKGYRVLLNDLPKGIGVSLDQIAENCDIITFHVPLTNSSITNNPTYHMCNEAFLGRCKSGALIINASRGGVVDEQALLRSGHPYVIDTWEGEPDLDRNVLEHARLASMHIAGYSVEGKLRASQMCLDSIAETFGLPRIFKFQNTNVSTGDSAPGWLSRITAQLKAHPDQFESLRRNYPLR